MIYSTGGWDVTPLQLDQVGQEREFGDVADWAARTVTVDGNVYYGHEVNYFMWGAMNAVAEENGATTSQARTEAAVALYRMYKAFDFKDREHDGMSAARVAWAIAGWDYVKTGVFTPPVDYSIPNATASQLTYGGFMGTDTFQVDVGEGMPVDLSGQ